MNKFIALLAALSLSNLSYAACIGGNALCYDDTGVSLAGVKFNGSFGTGVPAGSNTQIQYNNSNAFGASSSLFWDNGQSALTVDNGYLRGTTGSWLELYESDQNNFFRVRMDQAFMQMYSVATNTPAFTIGTTTSTITLATDTNNETILSSSKGFEIAPGTNSGVLIKSGASNTSANTSAQLDVFSTTKGFLAPRMSTVQRDAISSPAEGLFVVNTTSHTLEFFNGTVWKVIVSSGT